MPHHVILFEPEIPPNTGNIIRLCANIGFQLHLIEPLGFDLDEKKLRRAGLDYHEYTQVHTHKDLQACFDTLPEVTVFAFTTKTTQFHTAVEYPEHSALLFGPETRGLPVDVREALPFEQRVRLPMLPHSRSLNLSNSVAIASYEVWHQHGFANAT